MFDWQHWLMVSNSDSGGSWPPAPFDGTGVWVNTVLLNTLFKDVDGFDPVTSDGDPVALALNQMEIE